ncbi:MAG: hypothetical protein WC446_01255 [Candidatus Paceibacterota bacterium]
MHVASYNLLIFTIKAEENIQKSIKYSIGQSIKKEKLDIDIILSKINSYLRLLSHSNTYNLKKRRY